MKKALFALFMLLSVGFSNVYATTLDESMCVGFAQTAGNISMESQRGQSTQDILDSLDMESLKEFPKDIQELIVTIVKFVSILGKNLSPDDHFQGALGFCLNVGGDVGVMNKTLNDALQKHSS